ncbi:MAG: sugar phosphate isomerase/epimerase family protein [Chloroherpetonaceae bacterium]|nr:sugar phosphate isomerase/epimerase [Chthonomonadaceae bacterium]MDW8207095.1 sugar phosphate isomerase/epimerase family protein [Chloroherpetonaceae bacterium]
MYLSIRDDIILAAGYTTLLSGLQDLQIPGVELRVQRDDTVPAITPDGDRSRLRLTDPQDLARLRQQAHTHGITLAALCMGNNFNAPDRDSEIAWAVRTVRAAQQLGIPVVRVDPIMSGEQELPPEERLHRVATALTEILNATADTSVDLGVENHGHHGNNPEFLRALLQRVGNPRLGLTLDSGNFYWRGWPLTRVYQIFEEFAPVVKHTHIKNIAYPPELREAERAVGYEYGRYVCPIPLGDIDHTRYVALLKQAGYDRDLCLEDESLDKYPPEERKANLRAAADAFRTMLTAGTSRLEGETKA